MLRQVGKFKRYIYIMGHQRDIKGASRGTSRGTSRDTSRGTSIIILLNNTLINSIIFKYTWKGFHVCIKELLFLLSVKTIVTSIIIKAVVPV